jgi:hypothetical protein
MSFSHWSCRTCLPKADTYHRRFFQTKKVHWLVYRIFGHLWQLIKVVLHIIEQNFFLQYPTWMYTYIKNRFQNQLSVKITLSWKRYSHFETCLKLTFLLFIIRETLKRILW